MQKRLVKVGNSLALVIDASVLRLWNVTRMSRLSVELEGGRMVVTPVAGSGDPRVPARREAMQVVQELQRLGFKQAHFDKLAPTPMRLGTYVKRIDAPGELAGDVAVMMCRMGELRRLLGKGWNQRHAFATAIAAHPYELPSGIETRLGDDDAREDAEKQAISDYVKAEMELAAREEQFAAQEREDQRLAQEARDRLS